ncbi:tropomodulin [Echinococcus multilocularis]|uniref:Tropomodulin n=1 Tax=Echinococcus multilocularis TaxID=6211 RepID=A0A068YHK1_ECHMU|nr:tropomodulin [Echinococcus multilocularis]
MSNKTLFGKSLDKYDSNIDDIDDLLSKLTEAEIKELNDDIDPDNSLLPPSQRCRDQTTKAPTGPFNRENLIKFLVEKAKNDPDWDEAVPYEKKIRGKVFEKKKVEPVAVEKNELSELGFDVEFDESINEALDNATDDELIDLAAILGFTGMMNQVQFHASIENRGQVGGGFLGVAKAEQLKIVPDEPPNMTDVEESIKKLAADDASLTVLNLNNIKCLGPEVVSRLFTALGENTKLHELHMAGTNLTSAMVEPLLLPLKVNHTLEVLNLESNFITGDMILKILDSISDSKSAVKDLRLANQRQRVLGVQVEEQIAKLVLQNPRLSNLSLYFDTPYARTPINGLPVSIRVPSVIAQFFLLLLLFDSVQLCLYLPPPSCCPFKSYTSRAFFFKSGVFRDVTSFNLSCYNFTRVTNYYENRLTFSFLSSHLWYEFHSSKIGVCSALMYRDWLDGGRENIHLRAATYLKLRI